MKNEVLSKLKQIKVEHVVFLYFLLQPFLDIYTTYVKHPFQILGLSINVLVALLFVFYLLGYCFYKQFKTNKHKLKINSILFVGYMIIFLGYCILHYLNMQKFDDNIFNRHAYGFVKESYFMFRTYILPVILVYTLYNIGFTKDKILSIIKINLFVICFIIIFSNIFGISLAAYGDYGKFVYIDGSIFHWPFFNGGDNFNLYTSKGWFGSANELSAILLMFSPLVLYNAFQKKERKYYIFDNILLIMSIITMNMLGTRTACLGIFAVLVCVFVLYLFFYMLKKIDINLKKFIIKYVIISVFCILLFIISPFYSKNYGEFKAVFKERPVKEKIEEIEEDDVDTLAKFIEKHTWNYYIEPYLLKIYPVNNDITFWKYLINRDLRLNSNYRIIRTDICNRVIERNNNKYDKIFGIGFNDYLTSERDYYMQIFYFGIVGTIIFIGPFILNFLYSIYVFLKNIKELFNLEVVITFVGAFISLVVPYLTGHIFGVVFPMSYVILMSLLLLIVVRKEKNNED